MINEKWKIKKWKIAPDFLFSIWHLSFAIFGRIHAVLSDDPMNRKARNDKCQMENKKWKIGWDFPAPAFLSGATFVC
jgi:hypothetical protein